MGQQDNVINMKEFRTEEIVSSESKKTVSNEKITGQIPVLDMTERRETILNEERRQVKRTILNEFIGANVIVPDRGLLKIALHDISEDGLAFDLEPDIGQFNVGDEIAVRVYMNHKTYFPFSVKVRNVRYIKDEGVYRHGSALMKGDINEMALFHFVKFLETVSASLSTDNGDVTVSKIQSDY